MQKKQNRVWVFLGRGFSRGCIIAVLVLLVFFAVMSLSASAAGMRDPAMNFSSLLTILLFSFIIAYAQEIFLAVSLPIAARWGLHFLIIGIAYFFIILKRRSELLPEEGYLIGFLLYVFAYALISGLVLLFRTLRRRKTHKHEKVSPESDPPYTSMFTEK